MIRKQPRKPFPVPFRLADRVVAQPQRLRANEVATAATFALNYAAKWVQAAPPRR